MAFAASAAGAFKVESDHGEECGRDGSNRAPGAAMTRAKMPCAPAKPSAASRPTRPGLSHRSDAEGGAHGARLRGDPALRQLLDELASQSYYHHLLALVAASAAGDDRRLGNALRHPSPRIRSFALTNLAPGHLPTDEIFQAMLSASVEERRNLRRFVNRRGLTPIAESVIDPMRDELGDREAGALLAVCTSDTVRRLLPELLYAIPNLRSLAKRHPTVLLDYTEAELRVLPQRQRDLLWHRIDDAVYDLSQAEPDRLLRLLEDVGPSSVVPSGLAPALGSMIRFDASRVARLLVKDEFVGRIRWRLPTALSRNANRFESADQVAIARALREHENLFFAWIGSLAPSGRTDVFTRALEDLDTSTRIWAPDFLEVLPQDLRHSEARRILGVRAVRGPPRSPCSTPPSCPSLDARDHLTSHMRRSRADERAVGYNLLISCAGRDRSPSDARCAGAVREPPQRAGPGSPLCDPSTRRFTGLAFRGRRS